MDEEFLRKLGLSIARGVPQMATGMVDLAALPFTLTGLLDEKDVVGGTEYLTEMGLLPPPQEGLLNETTEMVSSALNPAGAVKSGLLGLGMLAGAKGAKNITPIFHGTSPSSAKAIDQTGFDVNKSADGTVWFTSNPNIGEVAATGKGAVVRRGIDESNLKLGGWDETDKFSTDELIQQGYDGLKLVDNNEITYQIFNPEKLLLLR